jgi:putative transposase
MLWYAMVMLPMANSFIAAARADVKADATIILTALAVDLEGNKEVLALHACAEESKEGWLSLLQDLRTRGATQIERVRD